MDELMALAHFLNRVEERMIPMDPAVLIDSDEPGYWYERNELKQLLEHWGPQLPTMTPKQFQDLLVTVFWVGKED